MTDVIIGGYGPKYIKFLLQNIMAEHFLLL